jgi:uncharacterized protein YkwD
MHSSLVCRRTHRALLAVALGALLAACGGGGGSGEGAEGIANSPAAAPTPPAGAASATTTPGAAIRATCNLPGFEAEALHLVNAHRAAGASCGGRGAFVPAVPLAWNDALTQAGLRHSDDMVAHNFFSHTGSDGTSAGTRATAAGYVWSSWGENIAAGQRSVADVVAGWMASDGHCANIMSPGFRDLGLACVSGNADTTYGTYWTMVLGAPR